MAKDKLICETCRQPAERLFQSYATGSNECAEDALNDELMPEGFKARIETYIRKRNQARANFGKVVFEPEAYAKAEEGGLFT